MTTKKAETRAAVRPAPEPGPGLNLDKFDETFKEEELEWRIQKAFIYNAQPGAIVVPYVTNRAIMNRLDEVCGKDGWYNEYQAGPDGGVVCGLSIRTDHGWVTKWDGAENTNIEAVKGGLSDSMKRAAVQWGIGRYLYTLPTAFASVTQYGAEQCRTKVKDKDGREQWVAFRWDPPTIAGVHATEAKRRKRREAAAGQQPLDQGETPRGSDD
jgi:hypothetical protein